MDKRVQRKFTTSWCYLIRMYIHVFAVFFSSVKINAGRTVTGILRGFDPYMNIVLDDAVEELSNNKKEPIGMIVSCGHVCVAVTSCTGL